VDVVIGYVETHKRAETEAMVEGLEIIPRKVIEHRCVQLTEMDVEDLLETGINVYMTLNIQHFENLNGVVAQITVGQSKNVYTSPSRACG
jgi:two-component system, OmpR family, sensor histidine kinase KdpD